MKDYCDFKTKQELSCVNKRCRELFRECQIQHNEHLESLGFWMKEHRIYDVDFDKLFKCFLTFKEIHTFSGQLVTHSFLYVIYSNDNKLENINVDLKKYFWHIDVVQDVELICGQVNVTSGKALQSYMKHDRDIVFSIMGLTGLEMD